MAIDYKKQPKEEELVDNSSQLASNSSEQNLKIFSAFREPVERLRQSGRCNLSNLEFNSVCGLISYVAHTQNVCETLVAAVLTTNYNVNELRDIPCWCYEKAVKFLVDLDMRKLVN
jgi:hypothetical protein